MTPQQIATQAAEAVSEVYAGSYENAVKHRAALILSAAAKMVRESGAQEALEVNARQGCDYCRAALTKLRDML